MGARVLWSLLAIFLMITPSFSQKSVDYLSLVALWPGAYCQQTNTGCCLPTTGEPDGDFLIRDLITHSSNGDSVTRCQNEAFDYNKISSLSEGLEKNWANIRCPSNNGRSSWKAKWKSYGVCSGFNQTEYFRAGLNALKQVDIAFNLVKKNIHPDYNLYSVADIKSAIAEGIGAEPLIRCSNGPFNRFQFFEVHVCFERNAETIIECPVKPNFTCDEEILFHPYREWMLNDTTKAVGSYPNIELPIAVD